jgi:hypothetical protein
VTAPSVFLRFDEVSPDAIRPVDVAGGLNDLDAGNVFGLAGNANMPTIVDGVCGRARLFGGNAGQHGLAARDAVPGSTLHNRDVSVRAILTYDMSASSTIATIIARGINTGAAEYVAFGLEVRKVNTAANAAEVRWMWHDAAGVERLQIGGHFIASASWMLLTATRRWVSSTEVVLRYYLGDQLLSEVTSVDGSIGGGTTALTSIGARFSGSAWSRWLGGKIDELQVMPYELTPEEVTATWRRITVHQPRGYQLLGELHDQGFPISADPSSRVQKETRQWGNGLGFAAAQAENVLENIRPDRAYGEVLRSWETVTAQSPKPGDSVDERRARVVARMRQRAGVSIPGVGEALRELVDTHPDNLEILAFDQTVVETFAGGLNTLRWLYDPAAQWTISASALRVQSTSSIQFTDGIRDWYTARMPIGGKGRGAQHLAKVTPTTLGATSEVGIFLGDLAKGNFILLGVRNTGAQVQVIQEVFRLWVTQGGPVVLDVLGGLAATWLLIRKTANTADEFDMLWSDVAEAGPYDINDGQASGFTEVYWAGMYARSIGAGTPTIDAKFDDVKVRTPYSDRAFRLYVFRDPALAGSPDLTAANNILDGLKQAHTDADVVTAKIALCDDTNTTCDSTPMGAI